LSPSFSIFSRPSNAQFASLPLLTSLPSRDLSSQSLTNCPPHNLFLLTSLQMPGGIGGRVQEFLKHYFNYGSISARLNHLQAAGWEKSLPSLLTVNCRLSTFLKPLPQPFNLQTFNFQPSTFDHPEGVRWNWAATDGKNEFPFRFQLRHRMDTEERSTLMILNELSSPRPRVDVAVPAWITSAEWPGIL
jgi:hypothetical protein